MDFIIQMFPFGWFDDIWKLTVMLFIILDPIGASPLVASLLNKFSNDQQHKIIIKACAISFFILLAFSICGRFLLQLFDISMPVFQMVGGILLFITSLDIIFSILPKNDTDSSTISIIPIAYPLLAGPGAMATLVCFQQNASFSAAIFIPFISLILVMVPTFLFLYFSPLVGRLLGKSGALLVEKLLGVLLTAIAMNFIVKAFYLLIKPGE